VEWDGGRVTKGEECKAEVLRACTRPNVDGGERIPVGVRRAVCVR